MLQLRGSSGAKLEMGGPQSSNGGAGHHWPPRWRRPWFAPYYTPVAGKQESKARLHNLNVLRSNSSSSSVNLGPQQIKSATNKGRFMKNVTLAVYIASTMAYVTVVNCIIVLPAD